MNKKEKIKEIADELNTLTRIVKINTNASQVFSDEQLKINKIVSEFKWNTEEQNKNNEIRLNSFQSQLDKIKTALNDLWKYAESIDDVLKVESKDTKNDIENIKTTLWIILDYLDVDIETQEASVKLVANKKNKKK